MQSLRTELHCLPYALPYRPCRCSLALLPSPGRLSAHVFMRSNPSPHCLPMRRLTQTAVVKAAWAACMHSNFSKTAIPRTVQHRLSVRLAHSPFSPMQPQNQHSITFPCSPEQLSTASLSAMHGPFSQLQVPKAAQHRLLVCRGHAAMGAAPPQPAHPFGYHPHIPW